MYEGEWYSLAVREKKAKELMMDKLR